MTETNETPPATPGPPAAKKPRKPRTVKPKPPKKERVKLGAIKLVVPYGVDLQFTEAQPPLEIAHDAVKVVAWAATVPELVAVGKSIKMIRQYNVNLTLTSRVVVTSKAEIEHNEEVQENQ